MEEMTHVCPDVPRVNLVPIPRSNSKVSRTSRMFPLGFLRMNSKCHSPQTGKDTPPGDRTRVSPDSKKVDKEAEGYGKPLSICPHEEGACHSRWTEWGLRGAGAEKPGPTS